MANTTTASFLSRFKTRTKDPNNRIFSDASALSFLNFAQLLHQKKAGYRWPENEGADDPLVTVAGTREYALPLDFGAFEMMVYGSEYIEPKDGFEFADALRINPNNAQGVPVKFYLRGLNIGFYPVPGEAVSWTLYYRKRLPTLTNGTSELVGFSPEHDEAILDLMEHFGWGSLPDPSGKYQTLALNKLELYIGMKLPTLKSAFLSRNPEGMFFVSERTRGPYHPSPLSIPYRRR